MTIEKFSMPLNKIPDFIAEHRDIKDIYLCGANRNFLEKIEKETKKLESILYSKDTKIFHYI